MANILFIDQYAVLGGAQRVLVDLVSAFSDGGHQVRVIFPGVGPVSDQLAAAGISTGQYSLAGLRSGRKGPFEKFRYVATANACARSIRLAPSKAGHDLVYINGPRAVLGGVLAARRMRLPVVVAVHLIHSGSEQRLLRWCFARPHVKLVTFCSRFAAEPFPQVTGKSAILPNWVAPAFLEAPSRREASRSELGIANDEVVAGVLGRVSKTKGQRLFLDAAGPLLKALPDLRLLIAGGADFEDSQEQTDLRAIGAGLGARVRFLEKGDAIPFLDALDISVVPSIRPEAFGLVAIESMARSLPVVATRRGGIQDSIEDGKTGCLVEAEPPAMGRAIDSLARDPSLRRRMGLAGRHRVESEYSPEILIPQAMKRILEVLR